MVFYFCLVPPFLSSSLAQLSSCSSLSSSIFDFTFFLNLSLRLGRFFSSAKASMGTVFWYFLSLSSSFSVTLWGTKKQKTQIFFWLWQQLTDDPKQSLSKLFCFNLAKMLLSLRLPSGYFQQVSVTETGHARLPSVSRITAMLSFLGSARPFYSFSSLQLERDRIIVQILQSGAGPASLVSQIIQQVAPRMIPSLLSYAAHITGRVAVTLDKANNKFISVGEDDLINVWLTQDMTSRKTIELTNQQEEKFVSIDYSPGMRIFVVGTDHGHVYKIPESNSMHVELIVKGTGCIRNLQFSSSQEYLAVSSDQPKGMVYSFAASQFTKCEAAHDGTTLFTGITRDQKVTVTIGSDGYALLHHLQPGLPSLPYLARYQIHKLGTRCSINFAERPQHPNQLAFAGASTLQQIVFNPDTQEFGYEIRVTICEQEQILGVCWLNQYILIVATESRVALWNYSTGSRFHVINDNCMSGVLSDGARFFGVGPTGIVYKYEHQILIDLQVKQALKSIESMANPAADQPQVKHSIQAEEDHVPEAPREARKEVEISKAAQLITNMPQRPIESYYQMHCDAQFMFYNEHGCVIKRTDVDEEVMELEFHDKFKIRRLKFESRGKYYCYFALTDTCFMYSNHSHAFFEMETYNRVKKQDGTVSKEVFLSKWDYKIDAIEGVAIGNTWAAVATKFDIRIFDFSGNEQHCICFDRAFLAMAAFEDILAVAYSASLPLAEAHIFEVKLWKVTNQNFKLQRISAMPVTAEHELKWFGFSHEGCLYSQDTFEAVRMYSWESDSWTSIYAQNSEQFKLYIQHIENYEIYGFKIEQVQGSPGVPTVLPRSLPRKVALQFPEYSLKFLTAEQNDKLASLHYLRLKNQHEKFRSNRWSKYKFARGPQNHMYAHSSKIKGEAELQETMTQVDVYVMDRLRKILPNLEGRLTYSELQEAKQSLLSLCHSLVYFPETLEKIHSILSSSSVLSDYVDPFQLMQARSALPYRKLSNLEMMVDLGWIERCQQ